MKSKHILILALILGFTLPLNLFSQEAEETKKNSKPVRKPFNANQLVDLQTVVQPKAKSLEMIIHHRFGTFENGFSDLFGIYASSNIRMGLNYGFTDKLMIGIGTEKDNKLQDIQWKYVLLQQAKSGGIPVSLTYYGNMAIDARDKDFFGSQEVTLSTRMSYFHQIIVSRKFSKSFSMLFAPGFTHINRVDPKRQNDVVSLALGGKYSITKRITVVGEYSHPLFLKELKDGQELPEPNLGFALEIGTSTHIFQITCSQYRNIIPQYNAIYNSNSLSDEGWILGFNINVKY